MSVQSIDAGYGVAYIDVELDAADRPSMPLIRLSIDIDSVWLDEAEAREIARCLNAFADKLHELKAAKEVR